MSHQHSDPELATILAGIAGPGEAFRHRQHVNLGFVAVRRHGMPGAVDKVCAWIRQIAVYEPDIAPFPWAA
ncbi:MAG TPA: hypothetical protein VFE14_09680 [Micromonosporaceae bacterium]|jgi:hypothetical protein|nr:hypothetical protein [Micromonosporaceae bacterium]